MTLDPITVKSAEAAEMLGISETTLRKLVAQGEIHPIRPPDTRVLLYEVADLKRFVRRSQRNNKPHP